MHGTDSLSHNVSLFNRTTYQRITCPASYSINRDENDPRQISSGELDPYAEDAAVTTSSSALSVLSNLNKDISMVLPRNCHLALLAKARLWRGPWEKALTKPKKLQAPVSLSSVQL